MLTTFPSLLMYGFFVPMMLRITVAIIFGYLAIQHFTHKKAVSAEIKWVSHEMAVWATGLLILAELALGILLFVGAFTQIAALLASLGFLKMAVLHKKMPNYAPLSRLSYVLLFVISMTLLISGAGIFAFDLPL
ncbi:MAG: DoxX family membrane protein [Patescibacteria group bacterium]